MKALIIKGCYLKIESVLFQTPNDIVSFHCNNFLHSRCYQGPTRHFEDRFSHFGAFSAKQVERSKAPNSRSASALLPKTGLATRPNWTSKSCSALQKIRPCHSGLHPRRRRSVERRKYLQSVENWRKSLTFARIFCLCKT